LTENQKAIKKKGQNYKSPFGKKAARREISKMVMFKEKRRENKVYGWYSPNMQKSRKNHQQVFD
jgi:hypothetical protein